MGQKTKRVFAFTYLFFTVFLTGCKSLYQANRHQHSPWFQSVAKQEFNADPKAKHSASTSSWYRAFNAPQLNRLIEHGLSENLDIAQTLNRLEQSRLRVDVSHANHYPTLDGYLSTESRRDNRDTVSGWNDSRSAGLNLSWEIDLFKRIKYQTSASLAQFKASLTDLSATQLLISGQIAQLYFDILEHQALVNLIEGQITTNEQFLELTQLRKATGQGSILDVQQQAQQLLNTQSQLPEVKRNLSQLRRSLNIVLGSTPLEDHDLVKGLQTNRALPQAPKALSLPTPKQLLTRLPDLKAAYIRLSLFDLEAATAAANRLPTLSLKGGYARTRTDTLNSITGALTSFSLNLTQPLLNAGRLKRTQKIKEAEYQEAIDAFKLTYLNTLSEVEHAMENTVFRTDRLANTQKRLELAQKNVAEAKFQYANGLTDYLNVLVSLTTLQPLEVQYLQDQGQLLDAYVQLRLATGGPIAPVTHADQALNETKPASL